MIKRGFVLLLGCACALVMLAACQSGPSTATPQPAQVQATATPAATSARVATATGTHAATATSTRAAPTAAATPVQKSKTHDEASDYVWDSSAVIPILLKGNSISANGSGVIAAGSQVTITAAGTYNLSGSLADGQIVVDTKDKQAVRLVLNGVDIRNSTSAPIHVAAADKVIIILADNTKNLVSDGAAYVFKDPAEDEPNAAIFSKSDLTIYGQGSLTVTGNYNDGIASKDGLVIAGGTLSVNAVDDGIRGKDYLVVRDGDLTIAARGDGLKSDDEEDAAKGYISIEAGAITITSGGDAITAQTDVMIKAGKFTLSSGGGSNSRVSQDTSAKGIKAAASIAIAGGAFTIDTADDAINTNGNLAINGGTYVIATGDDGLHADSTLTINGGDIRINKSYEGIESAVITINAGDIHIVSSDDGLNVAGGRDASGMNRGMGPGARPRPGGGPGQDAFTYSGKYYLYINGGYCAITSGGDGLDVNGAVEMTDGIILVHGPTQRMNSALDYDASFNISGGFVAAAGSSGMAQAPGGSSSQSSVLINFSSTQQAGALLHIRTSQGDEILTFSPTKEYQSLAFSSPKLVKGATYDVYVGGKSTGAVQDGLYQGGAYTPGAKYASFSVSGNITRVR